MLNALTVLLTLLLVRNSLIMPLVIAAVLSTLIALLNKKGVVNTFVNLLLLLSTVPLLTLPRSMRHALTLR